MTMPQKKLFRCRVCGDIHFGVNAPEVCPTCQQTNAYEEADKNAAAGLLSDPAGKKFWRCLVCGDIQIGKNSPEICPTCQQKNVYVEINKNELKAFLEI